MQESKMAQYEKDHIARIRDIAPDCMVLLKSDGSFPLSKPGKIAAYGSGVRHTIKGGTGSGDVNPRHTVNVEEGLVNAGFEVTTKDWLDQYDKLLEDASKKFAAEVRAKFASGEVDFMYIIGAAMPEMEYNIPMGENADTAIYVLSRNSGEGTDRLIEKGDFALTETEERDILYLAAHSKKFMLVLNVGGALDLSPVMDKVANILLLSQLGMTTGDSLADVLVGKKYPSGKLTATWARYEDYCHEGDFGDINDTYYKEGIYVGYRYFDSVVVPECAKGAYRRGKKPLFPFGFGLSYTSFEVGEAKAAADGDKITVTAAVQNTGKCPGKEVLQLYVSKPSVTLDQPYQVLASFAKTKELASGEECKVTLSFKMADIASFDAKTAESVLEAGDYVLRLGTSSRDTKPCAIARLDSRAVAGKHTHIGGTPGFEDWKPTEVAKDALPQGIEVINIKASDIKPWTTKYPVPSEKATALAKSLTDKQLIRLCIGDYKDVGSKHTVGSASAHVSGAAGEIMSIEDKGIPYIVMADGPAGVRLNRVYGEDEDGLYPVEPDAMQKRSKEFLPPDVYEAMCSNMVEAAKRHGEIKEQNASAMPIGTALAQSFDPAVCEVCGDIAGDEMQRFGVNLWLAPGMNIHRDVRCGRNFEYYSEDPLVSGKMAAGIARGVQRHKGCGVTIKHFCCNNQEAGRLYSNSRVSERALREIYLKGFEIAVKEGSPVAIMSSYNMLNGEHTSQRRDLLETLLRGEWGYKSFVMTDWVIAGIEPPRGTKNPGAVANGTLCAGNDIFMPGGPGDYDNIMKSMADPNAKYHVTRELLEVSAARLIDAVWGLRG